MASSSHSATASYPQSLAAYRDAQGFLPLVCCEICRTKLIGRISQKTSSKGKRFYKCPMLEHTARACPFYMFEEHYVEYLVKVGVLPPGCSSIGTIPDEPVNDVKKEAIEALKEATQVVARSCDLVENAVASLRIAETTVKDLVEKNEQVCRKVDRLGEIVAIVGLANLFIAVLVLLVVLVK